MKPSQFIFAGGLYFMNGESGANNLLNRNGDRDYFIGQASAQWSVPIGKFPLTLGADVMKNFMNYDAADVAPFPATDDDETFGFVLSALLGQLKQRGLLDDTLVIWGGEFGRTPMNEERNGSKMLGRDHHPHCFTLWMAGGGIKPGITYGDTDELGYHVAKDKVHVHDLQAIILHCFGLNHERLTYKFQGRDYRLTDVFGEVVKGILA